MAKKWDRWTVAQRLRKLRRRARSHHTRLQLNPLMRRVRDRIHALGERPAGPFSSDREADIWLRGVCSTARDFATQDRRLYVTQSDLRRAVWHWSGGEQPNVIVYRSVIFEILELVMPNSGDSSSLSDCSTTVVGPAGSTPPSSSHSDEDDELAAAAAIGDEDAASALVAAALASQNGRERAGRPIPNPLHPAVRPRRIVPQGRGSPVLLDASRLRKDLLYRALPCVTSYYLKRPMRKRPRRPSRRPARRADDSSSSDNDQGPRTDKASTNAPTVGTDDEKDESDEKEWLTDDEPQPGCSHDPYPRDAQGRLAKSRTSRLARGSPKRRVKGSKRTLSGRLARGLTLAPAARLRRRFGEGGRLGIPGVALPPPVLRRPALRTARVPPLLASSPKRTATASTDDDQVLPTTPQPNTTPEPRSASTASPDVAQEQHQGTPSPQPGPSGTQRRSPQPGPSGTRSISPQPGPSGMARTLPARGTRFLKRSKDTDDSLTSSSSGTFEELKWSAEDEADGDSKSQESRGKGPYHRKQGITRTCALTAAARYRESLATSKEHSAQAETVAGKSLAETKETPCQSASTGSTTQSPDETIPDPPRETEEEQQQQQPAPEPSGSQQSDELEGDLISSGQNTPQQPSSWSTDYFDESSHSSGLVRLDQTVVGYVAPPPEDESQQLEHRLRTPTFVQTETSLRRQQAEQWRAHIGSQSTGEAPPQPDIVEQRSSAGGVASELGLPSEQSAEAGRKNEGDLEKSEPARPERAPERRKSREEHHEEAPKAKKVREDEAGPSHK